MTNKQLARNIKLVGQACFVKHLAIFLDLEKPRADIVGMLLESSDYTGNSCVSRIRHARRVIKAGLVKEALEIIVSSRSKRVSEETREQARLFMKEYENVG